MSTLRSTLADLTASLTDAIVAAVRSASLDELLGDNGGSGGRATGGGAMPGNPPRPRATNAVKSAESGRLPRRSADDIAAMLGQVVDAVKKHKEGMRAEQIREALGLQTKEMPRVLKAGLASKKLKSKGQKRATTYFA